MWSQVEPKSIDELCSILHNHSSSFIYRGQAHEGWPLKPTILRDFDEHYPGADEATKLMLEFKSVELFRTKAMLHLPILEASILNYVVGVLVLMQHYGGSARLLDWSASPWVAAYFASIDQLGNDGAVYAINMEDLQRVSPASKLCSNTHMHNGKPGRLLDVMLSELWYRMSLDMPDNSISAIKGRVDIPRMNAQQSVFTIAGRVGVQHDELCAILPKSDDKLKIIISSKLKKVLLARLEKMNINSMTLFPDITGIAKRTKDDLRYGRLMNTNDFSDSIDEFLAHWPT